MNETTRQRILRAGAEVIHLKGYHHTGIQEILDGAGVPKGSFYHFFESKEDFGLQVIDYYSDQFTALTGGTVADPALSPLEKIREILSRFIVFFESRGHTFGCPIGNLSQEMGDLSPAFRKKLKGAIDSMVSTYGGLLGEAQAAGEVPGSLVPVEAASFIVSSWHGALIRMKVEKSSGPLENHLAFIFDYVLKKTTD